MAMTRARRGGRVLQDCDEQESAATPQLQQQVALSALQANHCQRGDEEEECKVAKEEAKEHVASPVRCCAHDGRDGSHHHHVL